MQELNWLNITYALAGIPSSYLFLRIAIQEKIASNAFFGVAILTFLAGVGLGYSSWFTPESTREWGDIISITLVLCGLFVKIRDSKPIFARFPVFLTLLPLVGILFYPMIVESKVVKDLLMIIYEGGALLVGLLVLSINQLMLGNRVLCIVGSVILVCSYLMFWFIAPELVELHAEAGSILFAIGMITTAYGFKKVADNKSYPV